MDRDTTGKIKNSDSANYAIKVTGISKTFKIPHEKISSLRGAFVNVFKKNTFEEFRALSNVSFEVRKGEFFGIIGRNGSGKSTLLKALAGIYQVDKGKIEVNGLISPFLELGIGFNPELSGRDNIYLNATVLGLSQTQISEKFASIVAFSELERFIDQKLKNYSSGMQVRLAFSVAIHANRDILLMDEVLAVGDTNFQSKCLEEFNKYKEWGKTVILVTHDIGTIQRYCDRAMLLRNGKVVKIGKAEEVGNEYVYQNMSDEEKRILTEERQKTIQAEKDQARAVKELEKMKGREKEEEKKRIEIEKKRIVEEKQKREEERKNKVAEITRVELFDKDENIKNVFETGEIINIKVTNKFYKEIDNPIFGIVIRDAFGKNQLFVTNTQFKKISTKRVGAGEKKIVYLIENRFATGEYAISPAIADKNAKVFFDWKDDIKKFKIVNTEFNSGGFMDFSHDIIYK